jgi:hypothetical protein
MDSLKVIAYNLLNKLRGGRSSNTEKISLDQLMYNVELYRALLIRRDMEGSRDVREFEQYVTDDITAAQPYINMKNIDLAGGKSYIGIGFAMRSVSRLPKPIRLKNQFALNITTLGRKNIIPVIPYQYSQYQTYNKYTKNKPRAYMLDNYLYIVGDSLSQFLNEVLGGTSNVALDTNILDKVQLFGVFEQPREVMKYNGVNPNEVDDVSYPISYDMVQRINESLIRGELQLLGQTQDETMLQP